MCLPQHSVDVVIRDAAAAAAAVAMVTALRAASRVLGLGAEGGRADAAVLAVNARPGRGHHGSLWTAGAAVAAAVVAGRLETANSCCEMKSAVRGGGGTSVE